MSDSSFTNDWTAANQRLMVAELARLRHRLGDDGDAAALTTAVSEARDAMDGEERTLRAYLEFVVAQKEVYRIIDEAEFVDPEGFRAHYEGAASRIGARLAAGVESGQLRAANAFENEVHTWAYMGMNVFLGLRFGVWAREDPAKIARIANQLLRRGLEA